MNVESIQIGVRFSPHLTATEAKLERLRRKIMKGVICATRNHKATVSVSFYHKETITTIEVPAKIEKKEVDMESMKNYAEYVTLKNEKNGK
jgi:hypothetical protein